MNLIIENGDLHTEADELQSEIDDLRRHHQEGLSVSPKSRSKSPTIGGGGYVANIIDKSPKSSDPRDERLRKIAARNSRSGDSVQENTNNPLAFNYELPANTKTSQSKSADGSKKNINWF